MPPIRKGDGTPVRPKGISQIRTGDGRILFDGVAIPDSVVSQYDPRQQSTGSISEMVDQVGNSNFSGSASVVSDGINGNQSYRFDPADVMELADTLLSSDHYALVFVAEQRQATGSNQVWIRGDGDINTYLQDDDGDPWNMRQGSGPNLSGGTHDGADHVYMLNYPADGTVELEIDGSVTLSGDGDNSADFGPDCAFASGDIELDLGEIFAVEDPEDGDLQELKERLQESYATPTLA